MHLVVGFFRIMLAHFLAAVYRSFGVDLIGRRVVRLCCSAFTAGAGLDDAAIEVIRGLGENGIRLLKNESQRPGEGAIAAVILKMLQPADHV